MTETTEGNRRVEKMRHQLARTTEAAERYERERWLASLAPEHRARHERSSSFCPECVRVNLAAFNATMRRAADSMARATR